MAFSKSLLFVRGRLCLRSAAVFTFLFFALHFLGAQVQSWSGGFDDGLFMYHFDRADRELDPASWMAEARRGLELALGSWERTALALYDDPQLRAEAAENIVRWSQEELERRFARWLVERFFGTGAAETAGVMAKSLDEANRAYVFHTGEDGTVLYDPATGDPLVLRPWEGRDMETDREAWRTALQGAAGQELADYGDFLSALFPELLSSLPEARRAQFREVLAVSNKDAVKAREAELEAILAREERLFVARRSGDIWSLRKQSENESAAAVTARLLREASDIAAASLVSLEGRIEAAEAGSGDLALLGNEWLAAFREQFDRGVKAWEDAEERFLVRRMEWERDSGNYFLAGEDAWKNAFSTLEQERLLWEDRARELFNSGEKLFRDTSEQLERAIVEAKLEFSRDAESRISSGAERARAWADMYSNCATVLAEARDNTRFWLGRFVDAAVPSGGLDNGNFGTWVSSILNSDRNLTANQRMAGEELLRWSGLYNQYRERAREALAVLRDEYNLVLSPDSGPLASVLQADSEGFFLDEYQVELLRTQAVAGYWEQRLAIAEAVCAYARELSAGRMTESETLEQFRSAKAAYDAATAAYGVSQERLREAGAGVSLIRETMQAAAASLSRAEQDLQEASDRYALQMAAYRVNSGDFILEELGNYYASLLVIAENRVRDDSYFTAYLKAARDYSSNDELAGAWNILENIVRFEGDTEIRALKLSFLSAESITDWYYAASGRIMNEADLLALEKDGLYWRLKADAEAGGGTAGGGTTETADTAALLLELYRELAPYSAAARRERTVSALNGLSGIFTAWGISVPPGSLPETSAAAGILSGSGSPGEAAAALFLQMDEELELAPPWLLDQMDTWKEAFLDCLAARVRYDGGAAPASSAEAAEYFETAAALIEAWYDAGGGDRELLEGLVQEAAWFRYLYFYSTAWENDSREIVGASGDHWRTYISSPFLDVYNINRDENGRLPYGVTGNPGGGGFSGALSWEEGLLADAWETAEFERRKAEEAIALFMAGGLSVQERAFFEAAGNYAVHPLAVWEDPGFDFSAQVSLEFFKAAAEDLQQRLSAETSCRTEIARLGAAYLQSGKREPEENLARLAGELDVLRIRYQSALAAYTAGADAFTAAGTRYETNYREAKESFNALKAARLAYEKADAVQRWAATAYLNPEEAFVEAAYARERGGRASAALAALEDLYSGQTRRAFNDGEYERLYQEYQASFTRLLLSVRANAELEKAVAAEEANNAALYNKVITAVSSLYNPAIFAYYENYVPSQREESFWQDYLILDEKGFLKIACDQETLSLVSLTEDGARRLFSYFTKDEGGVSAFETALAEWAGRMVSYNINNQSIYQRWGLALDYRIRQLIEANGDIDSIKGSYTLTDLGTNGSMEIDGTSLDRRLRGYRQNSLGGVQQNAWNALSDGEKNDLEFLLALFLSGGGGEGAEGLTMVSELRELKWLEGKADHYQIPIKIFGKQIGTTYRWPYTFDASELKAVQRLTRRLINSVNGFINTGRSAFSGELLQVSGLWDSWNRSNEALALLKGGTETNWESLETVLRYLQVFSNDEIGLFKEYWTGLLDYNRKNGISSTFSDSGEALKSLLLWSKGLRAGIEEQFEGQYLVDETARQKAQDEYRSLLARYIDGTADFAALQKAAETAYGDAAPALKNHLENLGGVMLKNLAASSGNSGEAELFRDAAEDYIALIQRAYQSRLSAELAAREAEWEEQIRELNEKAASWQTQAALILERGREGWKDGFVLLEEQYAKWTADFEEEYDRLSASWNAAFLESRQNKEAWVNHAMEAADEAYTVSLLSLIGSEAETLGRDLDTFMPGGVPGYGSEETAAALVNEVLSAAGIARLSAAFGAIAESAGTVGTRVSSGLSGLGLWNSGSAAAAARELARKSTEDLAAGKMAVLAVRARETAAAAKLALEDRVKKSNGEFDHGMDKTFTLGEGWGKSGSQYRREIIVHSTLFQNTITKNVVIDAYRWFVLDPWDFTTNLSDSYLAGMDYLGIEALIGSAQREVREKSETVFGTGNDGGLYGAWIGTGPEMVNGTIAEPGSGELGRLMREYYTWSIKQAQGIALTQAPFWDKPLWDSRGSWFNAPSLRTTANIAMTVIAAAAVPVSGGASLALNFALNLADDMLFNSLDVAYGYKNWGEAGFAMGQSILMNAVSTSSGVLFNGFGKAAAGSSGFFNSGGISGLVGTMNDGAWKTIVGGALPGIQALSSGTVNSILGAVSYSNGTLGWNGGAFTSAMGRTLAGAAVSSAGSYTTTSLNLWNAGEKLDGFSLLNKSNVSTLNGLLGGLAGEGLNYALTGDFALNAFNLGFLKKNLADTGLLELHFGSEGFHADLGSGGQAADLGKIVNAVKGALVLGTNARITNYVRNSNLNIPATLRAQYGFGDKVQKEQLWDILGGRLELRTAGEDELYQGMSIIENGKRVVYFGGYRDDLSLLEQLNIAMILGHEAYRDGYTTGEIDRNGNLITPESSFDELKRAVTARIGLGDRINEDYELYKTFSNYEFESYLFEKASDAVFDEYLRTSYNNEADYQWIWASNNNKWQNRDISPDFKLLNALSEEMTAEVNKERLAAAVLTYRKNLAAKNDFSANDKTDEQLAQEILADETKAKLAKYVELPFYTIYKFGCVLLSTVYGLDAILGGDHGVIEINDWIVKEKLYVDGSELSLELMAKIWTKLSGGDFVVSFVESMTKDPPKKDPNKPESEQPKWNPISPKKLMDYGTAKETYISHVRVPTAMGMHSEMVAKINYGYYSWWGGQHITSIDMANPYSGTGNTIASQTNLSLNQIARWDVFKVEKTLQGLRKDYAAARLRGDGQR